MRCPRHTIQVSGYGHSEYIKRVLELLGIKINRLEWKDYRATLSSMKAYPFRQGQYAIYCGGIRGGLITVCVPLRSGRRKQIIHLDRYDIPNYQWSALDVNSRFKLIAFSREKSWTNGLCWYLRVISRLRSHGVKSSIVFTVDNGEEFINDILYKYCH